MIKMNTRNNLIYYYFIIHVANLLTLDTNTNYV